LENHRRSHLAWSCPCADRGQIEPTSVFCATIDLCQISSTHFGKLRPKTCFRFYNRRRPLSSAWALTKLTNIVTGYLYLPVVPEKCQEPPPLLCLHRPHIFHSDTARRQHNFIRFVFLGCLQVRRSNVKSPGKSSPGFCILHVCLCSKFGCTLFLRGKCVFTENKIKYEHGNCLDATCILMLGRSRLQAVCDIN